MATGFDVNKFVKKYKKYMDKDPSSDTKNNKTYYKPEKYSIKSNKDVVYSSDEEAPKKAPPITAKTFSPDHISLPKTYKKSRFACDCTSTKRV